jgi:calcium-dependent protein kinase
MDANKDGRLSFEEVKNGLDSLSGGVSFRYSKTGYLSLMQSIDKDRNGFVDYQEFISAAIHKAALVSRDNLAAAFSTFDKDGSGLISVEELRAVFESAERKKDA